MDGLNENHVQFEGHDIFDMFFGGRARRPRRQRRGKDTVHHIKLSLEDLYNGKTIKLSINRKVVDGKAKMCEACNGTGTICEVRQLGPGFVSKFKGIVNIVVALVTCVLLKTKKNKLNS